MPTVHLVARHAEPGNALGPQIADVRRRPWWWAVLSGVAHSINGVMLRLKASSRYKLASPNYLTMMVFLTIIGRLTMTAGRRRTTVVTVF